VYDLVEDRAEAPKSIHEAAERGNTNWCVRAIERTIDFDVNQRDQLMRTALVGGGVVSWGRQPGCSWVCWW